MTVRELITELQRVEDKDLNVVIEHQSSDENDTFWSQSSEDEVTKVYDLETRIVISVLD